MKLNYENSVVGQLMELKFQNPGYFDWVGTELYIPSITRITTSSLSKSCEILIEGIYNPSSSTVSKLSQAYSNVNSLSFSFQVPSAMKGTFQHTLTSKNNIVRINYIPVPNNSLLLALKFRLITIVEVITSVESS